MGRISSGSRKILFFSPFLATETATANATALYVSYLIVHSAEWREPLSLINTPPGQHWYTSAVPSSHSSFSVVNAFSF